MPARSPRCVSAPRAVTKRNRWKIAGVCCLIKETVSVVLGKGGKRRKRRQDSACLREICYGDHACAPFVPCIPVIFRAPGATTPTVKTICRKFSPARSQRKWLPEEGRQRVRADQGFRRGIHARSAELRRSFFVFDLHALSRFSSLFLSGNADRTNRRLCSTFPVAAENVRNWRIFI